MFVNLIRFEGEFDEVSLRLEEMGLGGLSESEESEESEDDDDVQEEAEGGGLLVLVGKLIPFVEKEDSTTLGARVF